MLLVLEVWSAVRCRFGASCAPNLTTVAECVCCRYWDVRALIDPNGHSIACAVVSALCVSFPVWFRYLRASCVAPRCMLVLRVAPWSVPLANNVVPEWYICSVHMHTSPSRYGVNNMVNPWGPLACYLAIMQIRLDLVTWLIVLKFAGIVACTISWVPCCPHQ